MDKGRHCDYHFEYHDLTVSLDHRIKNGYHFSSDRGVFENNNKSLREGGGSLFGSDFPTSGGAQLLTLLIWLLILCFQAKLFPLLAGHVHVCVYNPLVIHIDCHLPPMTGVSLWESI